ncbi:restriction endonuclease subunit S [Burkholderia pyrrocinia]|uniref:restriction endonuclease subunit S n=1 Tax=Burkholderia pyrrocinia TaxID=60550 RepID=UPI002445A0D4|nr:restriction endonuclease subunit S [Burkholderia pyrrocinia]
MACNETLNLRSPWPRVRIGDVAEIFDGPHATPTKTATGPIFLGISALNRGRLDLSNTEHLSEEEFVKWTRRVTPKAGDVVFSYETRIGEAAIIPKGLRCCLGRRMGLVRTDSSKLDPHFFLYQYLGPAFQDFLASRTIQGSTVDRIALKEFPNFEIDLPPLAVQRQVAKVMADTDAKIDLSRRINQTLESMAQAIFKSWFVDFDPVKAKITAIQEGRDPLRAAMSAISGKLEANLDSLPLEQYEQLIATAALFPDEMNASALGEIPRAWAFQAANSLTEVGIGKTPPRKEPQWFTEGEGDWRWVSIKDMGANGVFQQRSSEFLTSEAVSRFNVRVVPDRTVLLSFKLTIGRVAISDGPMVTNEAIAHFKLPNDAAISPEYLYLYLKGFDYSTLGSTSSIADAVNSKTIREMPIILANRDLMDTFSKFVTPIFDEIRNRQNEIASLSATRDTLLPKLLSGEIEVPA